MVRSIETGEARPDSGRNVFGFDGSADSYLPVWGFPFSLFTSATPKKSTSCRLLCFRIQFASVRSVTKASSLLVPAPEDSVEGGSKFAP